MDDGPIRKRTAFLYFWWTAALILVAIAAGDLLSKVTGERWIPELGGIEWALYVALLFTLGPVKFLADEAFPPEDAEES